MVTLRRPARPRRATHPTVLNLRLSYQLRYALEDGATARGLSVSEYTRTLLAAGAVADDVLRNAHPDTVAELQADARPVRDE